MISSTKSKVIIDKPTYIELRKTMSRNQRIVGELRKQLRNEHALLLTALHDLAREARVKDRKSFVRTWIRDHQGVAIED